MSQEKIDISKMQPAERAKYLRDLAYNKAKGTEKTQAAASENATADEAETKEQKLSPAQQRRKDRRENTQAKLDAAADDNDIDFLEKTEQKPAAQAPITDVAAQNAQPAAVAPVQAPVANSPASQVPTESPSTLTDKTSTHVVPGNNIDKKAMADAQEIKVQPKEHKLSNFQKRKLERQQKHAEAQKAKAAAVTEEDESSTSEE
jgi:hypothetical protein